MREYFHYKYIPGVDLKVLMTSICFRNRKANIYKTEIWSTTTKRVPPTPIPSEAHLCLIPATRSTTHHSKYKSWRLRKLQQALAIPVCHIRLYGVRTCPSRCIGFRAPIKAVFNDVG